MIKVTVLDQSISTKMFSFFFIKLSNLSSSFFIGLRIRRMKMQFNHPTLLFWKNQRQYKRNSSLHSCNLYINLSALIFFLAPDICFSWPRGTFSNQMGASLKRGSGDALLHIRIWMSHWPHKQQTVLISRKRLELLRKAVLLQLIQNSATSVAQQCQCDIWIGLTYAMKISRAVRNQLPKPSAKARFFFQPLA